MMMTRVTKTMSKTATTAATLRAEAVASGTLVQAFVACEVRASSILFSTKRRTVTQMRMLTPKKQMRLAIIMTQWSIPSLP